MGASSRESMRAASFALMSVWREPAARACRWKGERERERGRGGGEGERRREKIHAGTTKTAAAATRPLRTPFYRFASPLSLLSLSLSLLLCRASPNSVVSFRLLSTLLRFFFVPTGTPYRRPPLRVRWHARTHACTHTEAGVVRQRGPPDSSPAA